MTSSSSSMVIVDNRNFEDVLKELPGVIDKSVACAFDCEFSGIEVDKLNKVSFIDTYELRYEKAKKSVETFAVFSVGLTFFFGVDTTTAKDVSKIPESYYKTYDFLLFKDYKSTTNFMFNNKSMKMNSGASLDFNRIFKHGITYLNEKEIEDNFVFFRKAREDKVELQKKIKYVENIIEVVTEWYKDPHEFANNTNGNLKIGLNNDFYIKLLFDKFHGTDFFPQKLYLTIEKDKKTQLKNVIFRKLSENDESFDDLVKKEIIKKSGFHRVMSKLKGYKGPILGYNCLLDLCHIFNKFIRPLPLDHESFKKELHEYFPTIIDVKYIITQPKFNKLFGKSRDRSLRMAFLKLFGDNEQLKILVKDDLHKSSFDSMATGHVYFLLKQKLGIKEHHLMKNKIFMMKKNNSKDTFDLTMEQRNVFNVDRKNVLFITEIPDGLQRKELEKRVFGIFKDFYPKYYNIDERTGFVVLRNKEGLEKEAGGRINLIKLKQIWNADTVFEWHVFFSKIDYELQINTCRILNVLNSKKTFLLKK